MALSIKYRKAYNITEKEIRYAMANSVSNSEASRFLGINLSAYRKYARTYFDYESGKDLYELHKNASGKGLNKNTSHLKKKYQEEFDKLVTGQKPRNKTFNKKLYFSKLVTAGYIPEKCFQCGFDEKRIFDEKTPLILDFKDGDKFNLKLENIEVLCYNCYFLNGGSLNQRYN